MEEKINDYRAYWQAKLQDLFTEIMMVSLEGDNDRHNELLEEFETTALILWRYDRKLREDRAAQNIGR